MATDFLQKSKTISFKGMQCLRNDYAHNSCSLCIDICPTNVFKIDRGRFVVENASCTSCGACLGGCPSEALLLNSFDPNSYIITHKKSENKKVSCKGDSVCLAAFDAKHWVALALNTDSSVVADLSHCSTCELQNSEEIFEEIQFRLKRAKAFLETLGLDKHIQSNFEKSEQKRFATFKKAVSAFNTATQESATELFTSGASRDILKEKLFKSAIREHMRDIPNTQIEDNDLFFFNKKIDFDACTNCQECTVFCPTNALYKSEDNQGISFMGGNCIGCGICDDVCQPNALSIDTQYDLVPFIYDRSVELVHYEMAQCMECKCAYPYKGGQQICDRCKDHADEFATLFALAKDQ